MTTKNVTVEVDTSNSRAITLKVSEEPVQMGKGDDSVEWQVVTTGWDFFQGGPHGGVKIKNPGGKFSPHSGSGKKNKWNRIGAGDKNTYRYTLSVTDNKDTVLVWDPSIMNN